MPPVPQRKPRLVRVLHEDPDLAHRLDPAEVEVAARQTVGVLEMVAPGAWRPVPLAQGKCLFGGLVLDGLLVRELTAGGAVSSELMGAGDVVLPLDADPAVPFIEADMTWTALEPTRVAWLDGPFLVAVRRWPELAAALLERTRRRLVRVGVLQAISQMTRVDDRVLMLLWHLAERWGRVARDGILLPIRLPHKAIARLIGAQRPSVTTAIGSLQRRGLLDRRADGAWLLIGPPPTALEAVPQADSPWRDSRTGEPAVARLVLETQSSSSSSPSSLPPPLEQRTRTAEAIARSHALVDASQALVARLHDDGE